MISSTSSQSVVETAYVVVNAHLRKHGIPVPEGTGLAALRSSYNLMAGHIQPSLARVLNEPVEIPVSVHAGPDQGELLAAFTHAIERDAVDYDVFRHKREFTTDELTRRQDAVRACLHAFTTQWPQFHALYGLLLPALLYAPDQGLAGGTASSVPGVLWIDPKEHWSIADTQEFLLHEFTHTTLFLEERRFGFYWNMSRLQEERYLARSAIRQDRRPLDKVLHSIVVSMEIIIARLKGKLQVPSDGEYVLHPNNQVLLDGVRASLDDTFQLPLDELLRPRPIEILELCQARLASIGPDWPVPLPSR